MHVIKFLRQVCFIALGSSMMWFASCADDFAKPSSSPDYYFPLVYGDLSLQNLVSDTSFIKTDPTGYLKVGFQDTVPVLGSSDLAQALQIFQTIDVPQPLEFINIGGGNDQLVPDFEYNFLAQVSLSNLRRAAFDNVKFKLVFKNTKTYALAGLDVKIPGLVSSTGAFSTGIINVPITTGGADFETPEYELTDAVWDLTGKDNDTTSMVYLQLSSASPIQGASGGPATVSIVITSYDAKYWLGGSPILAQLLSNIPVTTSNTRVVPTSTYQNIKSGSLSLSGINVDLNFQSTMGLPLGMKFVLGSFSGVDNNYVEMDTLRVNVDKGTIVNGMPTVKDNFSSINESNSNLSAVLTNFPSTMKVGAGGGADFSSDPFGLFVHDSSELNLIVDAEIPLAVNLNNLNLRDTLDFALGEDIDNEQVSLDTGSLEFTMTNYFPYGFNFVINAIDATNAFVDEVAVININQATIPPGQDKVQTPVQSTFAITVTPELFENLKKATKLEVRAVLNTPLGASPKIFTDYKLGFSSKARLKVTIDTAKQ